MYNGNLDTSTNLAIQMLSISFIWLFFVLILGIGWVWYRPTQTATTFWMCFCQRTLSKFASRPAIVPFLATAAINCQYLSNTHPKRHRQSDWYHWKGPMRNEQMNVLTQHLQANLSFLFFSKQQPRPVPWDIIRGRFGRWLGLWCGLCCCWMLGSCHHVG